MNVDDFFAADGPLSAEISGYSPREGQLEMTHAVDATVSNGGRLMVEAPCGVGKSVAVLAPVLLSGKKAILATSNIALSEQYVEKDFPLVARALGSKATVALAKGLANYVCLQKLDDLEESSEELDRVVRWSERTKTGDLSELDFVPSARALPVVTSSSEDCLKKACPRHAECFGLKAQAKMKVADVVVTNYHYLFAHLEVARATQNGAGILPESDVLVLDELHNVAGIARGFVGDRATEWAIKRALNPLAPTQATRYPRPALDVGLARRATAATQAVFQKVNLMRPGRIKEAGALDSGGLELDLKRAGDVYAKAISEAVDELLSASQLFGPSPPKQLQKFYRDRSRTPDEKRLCAWLERLRISGRSCLRIGRLLAAVDSLADPDNTVHYVELAGRSNAVCSAPIEVGPYLRERIWDDEANYEAVVGMSATLRDGSDSFDLVVDENGAEGAETLAVESPFDFSRCMLVCDADWPEPKNPKFGEHIAKTLSETIRIAGGRTLGLFASKRALDAAYAAVSDRGRFAGDSSIRVWKQGDAPRTELIRRFKEDETSVLLGTKSFWEGVDVPGRALSALFIEKLPFATPDDPVFSALDAKLGREAFIRYSVPKAVIEFRQGFGRLVRSVTDAGIVVCADPRLFTASYGSRFTSVLPQGCVAGSMADAREHLQEYLGR